MFATVSEATALHEEGEKRGAGWRSLTRRRRSAPSLVQRHGRRQRSCQGSRLNSPEPCIVFRRGHPPLQRSSDETVGEVQEWDAPISRALKGRNLHSKHFKECVQMLQILQGGITERKRAHWWLLPLASAWSRGSSASTSKAEMT